MPLEDFKKLLPYVKEVETVVLEGWGESLLHKDLLECIRLVKKEGPQVGFVTSAKGLTGNRVAELIEAGLDFIGFSIAGTTPKTHDAIRVNSHLPEVLNAIRFFNEEKTRQKADPAQNASRFPRPQRQHPRSSGTAFSSQRDRNR